MHRECCGSCFLLAFIAFLRFSTCWHAHDRQCLRTKLLKLLQPERTSLRLQLIACVAAFWMVEEGTIVTLSLQALIRIESAGSASSVHYTLKTGSLCWADAFTT